MNRLTVALTLCCFVLGGFVQAETLPAFGTSSNLKNAKFDPTQLTESNFYKVIVPLAKKEGTLNLYNFATSFPPLWKDIVIPRFEQKYGIKVNYFDTASDVADQQLVAAHNAGQDSPTDVYFASGAKAGFYLTSGVLGNLPLYTVLPEARTYQKAASLSSFGVQHGGSFLPFHRNQTAIGYNSDLIKAGEVPKTFPALLTWAKAHPGKLAVTSALKGGSGIGFAVAAANALMKGTCNTQFKNQSISAAEAAQWVNNSGCLTPVWTYLRALHSVSEITNGNNDTQNLLANNVAVMGTVWEDNAFTFVQRKQLPTSIRLTLLTPGQPGGGDGLFVTADAKHPAAAMLFINFALSAEIQTWKLENMASRSARQGITADKISGEATKILLPASVYPKLSTGWPNDPMQAAFKDAYATQVLASR